MTIRALAAVVGALLVSGADAAWAHHRPNNEVLVGGAISQTGRYVEPAGRQVNSIKLWLDQVNARGGLLGHTVRLLLLDDKSDTQTAIKLYEKLITEDKVDLVLGPYSSGITEAVANVTERYKMPFVAYGASSSPIWENGVKTAAIIGEDSLFPRQAGKGAKDWAKKLGIDIVIEENYEVRLDDPLVALDLGRGPLGDLDAAVHHEGHRQREHQGGQRIDPQGGEGRPRAS